MLRKLYESEEKRWIINSVGGQKGGNNLGNRTLHWSRPPFTSFKKWKNKTCGICFSIY